MAASAFGIHDRVACCRFLPILRETLQHPYHLGVGKRGAESICGDSVDSGIVMSIFRDYGNFSFQNDCLFTCVKIIEGSEFAESDASENHHQLKARVADACSSNGTTTIRLLCTEAFLEHYSFNEDSIVYAIRVNPFPIVKLVLGAKTQEAFEWINTTHNFTTGLLVSVCQEQVVIQKGDALLAPASSFFKCDPCDLIVLDCQPLPRGVLTITTEIVITRCLSDSTAITLLSKEQLPSPAVLSHFSKSFPLFFTSDKLKNVPSLKNYALERCVRISVVADVDAWQSLFCRHAFCDQELTCDDYNTVCVTKQCAKQLQLYDGSLVMIWLSDKKISTSKKNRLHSTNVIAQSPSVLNKGADGETKDSNKRVVQVKVTDECSMQDDSSFVMYMMPALAFNLQTKSKDVTASVDEVFLKDFQYDNIKNHDTTCSDSWTRKLPVSTEVHISCVHSTYYNVHDDYQSILLKHFNIPRLIQSGDILCINAGDSSELTHEIRKDAGQRRFIFFKVTKILPESRLSRMFVAHTSGSTLIQDGPVQGFLPVSMLGLHGHGSCTPAAGLRCYVQQLLALLLPNWNNRLPSRSTASVLLTGSAGCGKRCVVMAAAAMLHTQVYTVNCLYDVHGETSAAVEARLKHIMHNVCTYGPCILLLRNIHLLGKEKDGDDNDQRVIRSFQTYITSLAEQSSDWPVAVIATTSAESTVATDVCEVFLHHIHIESPNEVERLQMLQALVHPPRWPTLGSHPAFQEDIALQDLARRTAGLVYGDLCALRSKSVLAAYRRALILCGSVNDTNGRPSRKQELDLCLSGLQVNMDDLNVALDQLHAEQAEAMAAPKIPNVKWSDVGGLANVKNQILDTIQLPQQHPELFAAGLRRSGLLFYGPPGTGKTLLAKAVATECSLNFFSVKGPELINMYLGQSEENVREVFKKARSASPCVVFFDELDALAPNRGRSGDSGGVMDRVVSQLLAELDGLHKSCDVFVIGATNRPDLLDPALLRPGRFEKMLYLGVSETDDDQLKILKALTNKFQLSAQCNLENVAVQCSYNMTGADFYALCSDAALNAIKRRIQKLESGVAVEGSVKVDEVDFLDALQQLVPSVSDQELVKYKLLQQQMAPQVITGIP